MSESIPRLSIGLPVYNGENYVAQAIDSLLAQTFTDFELIISDNASTDRTAEICRAFAERDRRIRYYREPQNRGMAWNFNRTFELARAPYFKWHAHDDRCAPTLLERSVDALDRDPSLVLCYARAAVIDSQGNSVPDDPASWRPPVASEVKAGSDRDELRGLGSTSPSRRYYSILLDTIWCLEAYGVVRTNVMATTGKMRDFMVSEKVFLAELALRGRIAEIPEKLFYCRRHAAQYSLIPTASAQCDCVRPRRVRLPLPVPHQLRPTIGYLIAPFRSPISWGQRMRCLGVFLRFMFQMRKWKRIIIHTMNDTGMAKGLLVTPESKKQTT